MTYRLLPATAAIGALALAFTGGVLVSAPRYDVQPSAIRAQQDAKREDFAWGTLYTYYAGESYGTKDGLAAVAVIKPGMEIHPPHEHAEEEYLMVVQGEGTWHLNGKEQPARAGDMQYAAPWDLHGVKNTGSTPLTFVVWKWNNKGVELPIKRGS
jgi:mannose-6-phosphate isomerase-like protein (cupin superfamily)